MVRLRVWRLWQSLKAANRPPVPSQVARFAPVEIVWWDAHALTDSWTEVDSLDLDPRVITTVGMLIPNLKQGHYTVAQSVDGSLVDNVIAIPEEMLVQPIRFLAGIDPSS